MEVKPSAQPATPSDAGSGTSIEKFKSHEDRDKAYLELEKLANAQAQRMADMEKKMADFEAAAYTPPANDGRSFTDLYPATQPQQPQDTETQLASRLLTKPSDVLREHAEFVRKQTMQEVAQYMEGQNMVSQFKASNPDLAPHEEIVAMYVRKQPSNLSPAERLKRAAPEARKYLASIANKAQPASASLDPASFVEAPTSQPSSTVAAPAAPTTEEDELSEFLRDRAALQAKRRL